MAKNKSKIIETRGDRVLHAFTTAFLILVAFVVGYPVLYVISCSFSSDIALQAGRVLFFPVEPTLAGYKFVLQFKRIWLGYRNTIFYTVVGVILSVTMAVITAYPLSRPKFMGRNFWMKFFFITTMLSAGLIPGYMVRSALGMVNTIWAVLLLQIVGVNHVIILRTSMRSGIPGELLEAAEIDGASEAQMLVQIVLPLIKATVSVIVLYSAVGCWNEYFTSMIYLRDSNLYPLQLFLRPILTAARSISTEDLTSEMMQQVAKGTEQIQFCLIVMSTVPVLVLYFVVQKYFKKGVMIGSVKG